MPQNETDEADFVIESIRGIALTEKRKYSDFCVLMRANTQSRALEEALLSENIPYTMSGGTSFFQRKEIKDIISYLRVVANHDDDVNLLRVINTPRRGIGRATIEKLNEIAKANSCSLWDAVASLLSFSERGQTDLFGEAENDTDFSDSQIESLESFKSLIEDGKSILGGRGFSKKARSFVDEIRYNDYLIEENQKSEKAARFKMMNIESLLQSMERYESNPDNDDPSLYTYLNRITLLSRDDMDDEDNSGKVNLMTIHASKGLEFPVVFIVGAEEGLIPHGRAIDEGGDKAVEEERRLFYVAITRARDKLLISSCKERRHLQSVVDSKPSRFLDEIPPNLVEYHEPKKIPTEEETLDILSAMRKKFMKPIVPGF